MFHKEPRDSLRKAAEESRVWLFEAAAPLWLARRRGDALLFPERMSIAGETDDCPLRLLVQARHIFAYCTMGRLGWHGPWREMATRGAEQLIERGRRGDGFYVHHLDATGAVLDPRAHLYDQAFVLLAFAHTASATDSPHLLAAAEELDDILESRWRRNNGRYHEGEVAHCPPCRQNPHMHLLESFITLETVSGAPRWRKRAQHLAELCINHFLDRETGALREHLDTDLHPMAGEAGSIVEPGHCFEWAWLFEKLVLWNLDGAAEASDGLVDFARRHGIDRTRGIAVNEIMLDGTTRNADARLWPQTERLKAALLRYRRTGDEHEGHEALDAYAGLVKYFNVPRQGAWRDTLHADGSWLEEPAPGSSLYHIVGALAELMETASGLHS